MNIKIVDIKKLQLWKDDPRDIHKEDFGRLKRQIQKLGVYKPLIAVCENGKYTVLGGNMRLRALQELGFKKVEISVVSAPTQKKKIEYSLSDNDRVGFYVGEQLEELIRPLQDDLDLSDFKVDLKGMDSVDLNSILDQFTEKPEEEFDLDEALEKAKKPKSKRGQIYKLGKHRLMCGDATCRKDVEKLMDGKKADMVFTDPPYGIDLIKITSGKVGGGTRQYPTKRFKAVVGDNHILNPTFLLGLSDKVVIWGGNYFANKLPASRCWFVWNKNHPIDRTFANCELAWTNLERHSKVYDCTWDGYTKEGEDSSKIHPTQKPIKLFIDILQEIEVERILDLFGGSGTTLIACEKTNRICYMMEIDPVYCDVIRERYNNYVKEKA